MNSAGLYNSGKIMIMDRINAKKALSDLAWQSGLRSYSTNREPSLSKLSSSFEPPENPYAPSFYRTKGVGPKDNQRKRDSLSVNKTPIKLLMAPEQVYELQKASEKELEIYDMEDPSYKI